jgi:hypothetical protein
MELAKGNSVPISPGEKMVRDEEPLNFKRSFRDLQNRF